jgi:hypothetical protein
LLIFRDEAKKEDRWRTSLKFTIIGLVFIIDFISVVFIGSYNWIFVFREISTFIRDLGLFVSFELGLWIKDQVKSNEERTMTE